MYVILSVCLFVGLSGYICLSVLSVCVSVCLFFSLYVCM